MNGCTYHSTIAVIASGTKPRTMEKLHIPEELKDRFFYEVYPLLGEAGKQIVIIGAGDAAFDYALNLARNNKVIILNRGTEVSCLPLLWERTKLEDNIEYHQQTSITRVSPGPPGRINLESNKSKIFIADYLIAAIGRDPNLDFISGQFSEKTIQLEDSGKLYFVGDVANGLYRQTAIAVGDGILAAMKIYKFLKEKI
jgi:thioredoxin reductase (NADPH)